MMKNVLAICDHQDTLSKPFALIIGKTNIVYRTTREEIALVRTLDTLDVYHLIVISAIRWRVPYTCSGLALHFRACFQGPIIAIGNHAGWQTNMRSAHCTRVLPNNDASAREIFRILFPPT